MTPVHRSDPPAWRGFGDSATHPFQAAAEAVGLAQDRALGSAAKRRTRRTLRPLERSGWRVDHDVVLPGGIRVDHLVVAPSGAFVIDSRAWAGVVTVDNKGATITPRGDPGAAWTACGHHRSFAAAAAAVVRSLGPATGETASTPHAVVAIWSPFPDRVAVSGRVTYVAGDALAGWLSDQSSRLADPVGASGVAAFVPEQRSTPRATRWFTLT